MNQASFDSFSHFPPLASLSPLCFALPPIPSSPLSFLSLQPSAAVVGPQGALTGIHSVLKGAGVPGAWGISIMLFTIAVKGITYPLNYKQMASTMAMQKLSPKLKAIQARYKDDPAKMNEMTAQLYKDEAVNPLAGCLPTLIQVFPSSPPPCISSFSLLSCIVSSPYLPPPSFVGDAEAVAPHAAPRLYLALSRPARARPTGQAPGELPVDPFPRGPCRRVQPGHQPPSRLAWLAHKKLGGWVSTPPPPLLLSSMAIC